MCRFCNEYRVVFDDNSGEHYDITVKALDEHMARDAVEVVYDLASTDQIHEITEV